MGTLQQSIYRRLQSILQNKSVLQSSTVVRGHSVESVQHPFSIQPVQPSSSSSSWSILSSVLFSPLPSCSSTTSCNCSWEEGEQEGGCTMVVRVVLVGIPWAAH